MCCMVITQVLAAATLGCKQRLCMAATLPGVATLHKGGY